MLSTITRVSEAHSETLQSEGDTVSFTYNMRETVRAAETNKRSKTHRTRVNRMSAAKSGRQLHPRRYHAAITYAHSGQIHPKLLWAIFGKSHLSMTAIRKRVEVPASPGLTSLLEFLEGRTELY